MAAIVPNASTARYRRDLKRSTLTSFGDAHLAGAE